MSDNDEPGAGHVIAGRFRLEAPLGEGGMGVVWRATQLNLDRELAVKLLRAEYAVAPGARARFEREARVASQLKHPNAVQIYDFGDDGEHLYLVMEMLEGTTVRSIVDAGLPTPPLERTLTILTQVADALIGAHEISLVHRDLKPENVFLERTPTGERAVVVDFGLAFIAGRPKSGRLTREGIATGTPDYMSPEQAAGDDVGPAADVYALGIMLYEMLTGRVPFLGSPMQVITQQLFSAPMPPREVRRDLDVPRDLEDLCLRMLAKQPAERPAIDVVHGLLARRQEAPVERDRERGRDRTFLQGRGARMISAAPPPHTQHVTRPEVYRMSDQLEPVGLAVIGSLAGDLSVALGANGLLPFIVSDDQPVEGASAIFAPGASAEELSTLAAHELPLITDTSSGDMERVTRLLRSGVDEVVTRPVHADELARRVWRAVRRRRRRGETQ